MASLKSNRLDSSKATQGRWQGKPVVYLEGESDRKVFENYWFTELLDELRFDKAAAVQGCAAVVNEVKRARRQGIAAFGIVDRDKLMSDHAWELLRETDDAVFESKQPYPNIKVTQRWELECYLIEPHAVEEHLAPAHGGRAVRAKSEVVAELLEHADALIPFAALNQALHLHGKDARGDGYTDSRSRAEVEQKIAADHAKNPFPPDVWADYRSNIPKIEAFDDPTAPSEHRLMRLLRTVDGKAMLNRIKRTARIQADITYHLAKEIKRIGVPYEIDAFVRKCCGLPTNSV